MTHPVKILLTATLMFCAALNGDDLFVTPQPRTNGVKQEAEPNKQLPPTMELLPQGQTDAELAEQTIKDQLASLRSLDVSRAYYAYTTRDFQKSTSLEAFKQFVKKYSVLFRNKQVTKDSISFTGNTATFKGKLISTDGDVFNVEIFLVYNGEEWKIHAIKLFEIPKPYTRQKQ